MSKVFAIGTQRQISFNPPFVEPLYLR